MKPSSLLALLFLGRCALGVADALDDPMRPTDRHGHGSTSAAAVLQLDGIIERPGGCVALMGDRLVHAGDHFADVQIDRVTADTVYYHRAGQALVLRLSRNALVIRRDALTAKDRP